MENPRTAKLVQPLLSSMFGEAESDALGIDMGVFFQDLPLTVLLSFNGDPSPHAKVSELLKLVKASEQT